MKGNNLGCAYYVHESLKLYVMEDAVESNDFAYTSILVAQCMPNIILLPDLNEDSFIHFLNANDESIEMKKMPPKDFNFEKGQYSLLNWYTDYVQTNDTSHMILVDPEEGNKTHVYLRLEGLINLNASQLTVGCAGVLLKYLRKIEQQEANEISIQPTLLEIFSNHKCMRIDSDTLRSLSIFEYELHPNMHQKQEKESLSIFGLLNKTKTILGKQKLKEWVSCPIIERSIIEERQATIEFFMQSGVREDLYELRSHLSQISNIHRLLSKIREHKANPNDWQYTLKFAYYSICIFGLLDRLKNMKNELDLFKKTQDQMSHIEDMKIIGADINSLVDFEASKREGRNIIKEGIDTELDTLKKKYESLDDYLLHVAQDISTTLPVGIGAALNVVYFPQLGYLLTLPKVKYVFGGSNSSVISEDPYGCLYGLRLQFTTADNLYYKNERTKELDETIGDIHAMIVDREIEIVQGLSERVLEYKVQFTELVDTLSYLDCLIALSVTALKFGYVKPVMTDTNVLEIKKGRHPLQELCVETFIPNDTHLEGGKGFGNNSTVADDDRINSIQVVTGANFSGKSVYLKQVALVTFMAHIGSFIPASSATVGITDKLFTRTQTLETISKPQSAFAYDLQQLQKALSNSTCRSLVIIDEFGKGTENTDGAALFCSILGYFLSMADQCPKVLSSTHFHDLISQNILSSRDCITLSHTEIICQEVSRLDEESKGNEAVFLYRIVPGIGYMSSYGIWCAGIAGLPTPVVERALVLSEKYSKGEDIDRVTNEEEQEHFQKLEMITTQFLSQDINEMNPRAIIASIQHLFK
ncbi:unnamed protein product [Rhizopus stolonifer]